jgi:large subunit ribosomal protein L24
MDKIRKGDEVVIITGKDKGKRGTVLRRVDVDHVLVEGVNRAKKHVKPNPVKGVARRALLRKTCRSTSPMLRCLILLPKKADRVGFKTLWMMASKVRVFKSNGELVSA